MIRVLKGESLLVEVNVVDAAGVAKDLTGASSLAAYKKVGAAAVEKSPTITDNIVSVSFTAAETATMAGQYAIEIKVKDSDNYIDAVYMETLNVEPSLIPDFQ